MFYQTLILRFHIPFAGQLYTLTQFKDDNTKAAL